MELKRAGACADLLGRFFSADGQVLDLDLSARATSMTPADLRAHRIVAIGGGLAKVAALRAVLRSGLLHGLIIDEVTAQALVTDKPRQHPARPRPKVVRESKRAQWEVTMFDREKNLFDPTPPSASAGVILLDGAARLGIASAAASAGFASAVSRAMAAFQLEGLQRQVGQTAVEQASLCRCG